MTRDCRGHLSCVIMFFANVTRLADRWWAARNGLSGPILRLRRAGASATLSTSLDVLDLMLHPKQGLARDVRATEVLYGGAAETTIPAVRSGVRCQHNARSANIRGCRADGNDRLDFHPRRRARRSPPCAGR